MAGRSAEPPPVTPGPSARANGAAADAEPPERHGVVAIARHRKDDGRALILYTRAEGEGG